MHGLQGTRLSQCDKCSSYKPPRTHHCRSCRRCILRMDHHCMWINNCVGLRNYKAFIVLVLYATMASIYSSVVLVSCTVQKDWNFSGMVSLKIFYVSQHLIIITILCNTFCNGLFQFFHRGESLISYFG
ncbi:hypothetical protein CsSME_00028515 [Camellia sinensis var. sinensis]